MFTVSRSVMIAALSALAILVSGCSISDNTASPDLGSVSLPDGLPHTFADTGEWRAEVSDSATPVVTPHGVLAVSRRLESDPTDSYRLTMLSSKTGKQEWRTSAVTSAETPRIYYTTLDGHPWVVMVATTKDSDEVLIVTFDGLGVGKQMDPVSETVYTGDGRRPSVTVSDAGVLVRGAEAPGSAFQYHPASGATTVYAAGPTRGGEPGIPTLVRDDAWLVEFPESGFALASESGGWDSTNVRPRGAEKWDGNVVGVDNGYLLAEWATSEGDVLAIHSIRTGRVRAEVEVSSDHPADDFKDSAFVVAQDGRWAMWGDYAFNLVTGEGKVVATHGASPRMIHRDLLYASGAEAPLTPPEDDGGAPSDVSTRSVASESSGAFNGFVVVDLPTRTPVTGDIASVPIGVSPLGQGIFVANDVVYSVALR